MEFTQQKRGELSHEIRIFMDIHRSIWRYSKNATQWTARWTAMTHLGASNRATARLWSLAMVPLPWGCFCDQNKGKKDGIWSNMIKYDKNDQKESMFILQNQKTWCSGALSPGNFRDPDVAMILLLKDSLPRWICFWAISIDIQSVPHHCWICPIY